MTTKVYNFIKSDSHFVSRKDAQISNPAFTEKVTKLFTKLQRAGQISTPVNQFTVHLTPSTHKNYYAVVFEVKNAANQTEKLIPNNPRKGNRNEYVLPPPQSTPLIPPPPASQSILDIILSIFTSLFSCLSPRPKKPKPIPPPTPQAPALVVTPAPVPAKSVAPLGIPNTGNTCFMAATIQAILNDEGLCTIIAEHYTNELKKKPRPFNEQSRAAYQRLVDIIRLHREGKLLGDLAPLRGLDPTKNFGANGSTDGDADEFLHTILGPLEPELAGKSYNNLEIGFLQTHKNLWMRKDSSKQTIGGMTKITEGNVYNPTFVLPMELNNTIPKGERDIQAVTKTLFNRYTVPSKEITLDKTLYSHVSTETAIKTPPRFAVSLKRYDNQNRKKNATADMPESLTIEGQEYQLKSIVVHVPGHYYSYVNKQGNWFKADDSQVTSASSEQVKQGRENGYLYFYEKSSTISTPEEDVFYDAVDDSAEL